MSRVRVLQGAIYLIKVIEAMNDNFQNAKNAIATYFRGVKIEWGKITWPERQQVIVETFFVVAIVFIFTIFIYGVDKIFEWILSFVSRA